MCYSLLRLESCLPARSLNVDSTDVRLRCEICCSHLSTNAIKTTRTRRPNIGGEKRTANQTLGRPAVVRIVSRIASVELKTTRSYHENNTTYRVVRSSSNSHFFFETRTFTQNNTTINPSTPWQFAYKVCFSKVCLQSIDCVSTMVEFVVVIVISSTHPSCCLNQLLLHLI